MLPEWLPLMLPESLPGALPLMLLLTPPHTLPVMLPDISALLLSWMLHLLPLLQALP
jgi:hypothetical protein